MAYRVGSELRGNSLGKQHLTRNLDFKDEDVMIDVGSNFGDFKLFFDYKSLNICYGGLESGKSNTNEADLSLIKPIKYSEIVYVEAKKLDDLFDHLEKIKLIKIETEGTRPEVLEGVENILSKTEYICADLRPERGVKQDNTVAPFLNYLYKRGLY